MTQEAEDRVVVLGASGTLGTRIVGLLRRELPSVRVVGACRHPESLATSEARYLDLEDPSCFPSALEGARALVHAAGPFHHDAGPLVSACLEAGVDYLDLAEDTAFLARARSAAAALAAPRARAVTGCSTVPGLIALLARRFEGQRDVASIDAHLSLGARNPVSVGLLYGLLRPIGQAGPTGEPWFSQLARFQFADGRVRSFGSYPIALEKGVDLEGHTVPVHLFVGFDRVLLNLLLAQSGRILPRLSHETLRRLCVRMLPIAQAARVLGGEEGRLALVARDASDHELARLELYAESEGLEVPATPVVWALRRLLESRDAPAPGVASLEHLADPGDALDWLRTHGYHVVERGVH